MTKQQHHTDSVDDLSEVDREKVQQSMRLLLEAVGEDPEREGLKQTWQRRVPAVLETLTEGERESAKPELRTFDTEGDAVDVVIKTGIPVYSLCEHHLLPYHGVAHIAYRPDGTVVGLSKLTRYVRWQSRRLTVQENLTRDIAEGLATELNLDAVRVEISAEHLCEAMRGIETSTRTATQATVGELTSNEQWRFRSAVDSYE